MEPTTAYNFGLAIAKLRRGERVRRSGWNGKGMWLTLVPGEDDVSVRQMGGALKGVRVLPFIAMSTVVGDLVPWLASQTDMLAGDWEDAVTTRTSNEWG
jgi:Protein of unknown function (DUF2829)